MTWIFENQNLTNKSIFHGYLYLFELCDLLSISNKYIKWWIYKINSYQVITEDEESNHQM